jgi:CRP/FNR family cyclic AMP-dependent transcriptional regulator
VITPEDLYVRLKAYLEASAMRTDDGLLLIGERLTHEEIGYRLGCSRSMLAKQMKSLQMGGYVANHGKGMVLLRALPARW